MLTNFSVDRFQRRPLTLLLLLIVLLCAACTPSRKPVPPGTVPSPYIPTAEERKEARQFRSQLLSQIPLSTNSHHKERVRYITERLLGVVGSREIWNVFVLENPQWNAFTTKGNDLYFFTGLIEDLESDDELAAVIAHEIAHSLTGHVLGSSEQNFNNILSTVVGLAVSVGLASQGGAGQLAGQTGALAQQITKGLIVYPYEREEEYEADHVGLFLMADAGFNPERAISLWDRKAKEGQGGSEFFSTHPQSTNRKTRLLRYLPEADRRYRSALKAGISKTHDRSVEPYELKPTKNKTSYRYMNDARQAMQEYRFSEARMLIDRALSNDRNNVEALSMKGIIEATEKDYTRAIKTFETIQRKNPKYGTAYYNEACMHALLGNKQEAMRLLRKAVMLDPSLAATARDDADLYSLRDSDEFIEIIIPQTPTIYINKPHR